jgi:DNA-binding NarL/FixJ family response regulator
MVSPINPDASIASTQPLQAVQAAHPAQAPRVEAVEAQAQPQPQAPLGSGILVELSPAAQARLLKSEGQSVPEIALKLRLDETTVGNYIDQLI